MIDFSKLIYLPLDIPNPPNVSDFFDSISYDEMIVDNYRTCFHIPVADENGNYSDVIKHCEDLLDWFENHIFTWADRSRMRIITTPPGESNAQHIDCSPKKFLTLQHKFRYVFRGDRTSLIFNHKDGDERIHDIDKCYMMDGKWPHEMINSTNDRKYTLTLGAPWEPQLSDKKYLELLERSYIKYKDYYMSSDEWQLPAGWKQLFHEKYTKELDVLFDQGAS